MAANIAESIFFGRLFRASTVYTDDTPPIPTFPTKISEVTHCVAGSRVYCLFLSFCEEIYIFFLLSNF